MSRIRGSDTQPERLLRRILKRGVTGQHIGRIRPDLVLTRPRRVAIFIDGCFWHGCPDHYVSPRSGGDFWANKLLENTERDSRQTELLREAGWLVIRLWEHEIREDLESAAAKVNRAIESGRSRVERWRVVRVTKFEDGTERRELRRLLRTGRWRFEEGPRSTAKLGRVRRALVEEGKSPARESPK